MWLSFDLPFARIRAGQKKNVFLTQDTMSTNPKEQQDFLPKRENKQLERRVQIKAKVGSST